MGNNNQEEPVWRTVLSFVVAPLVAFSLMFFRARVLEQDSLSYSIALGIFGAAVLLTIMTGILVASRRRR
jgi:hypothetical protein